jgi:hypothetical protein
MVTESRWLLDNESMFTGFALTLIGTQEEQIEVATECLQTTKSTLRGFRNRSSVHLVA